MGVEFNEGQMAIAFEFRKKVIREEINDLDSEYQILMKGISSFNFKKNSKYLLNMLTAESNRIYWKDASMQEELVEGKDYDTVDFCESGFIKNGTLIRNEDETMTVTNGQLDVIDDSISYSIDEKGKVSFSLS